MLGWLTNWATFFGFLSISVNGELVGWVVVLICSSLDFKSKVVVESVVGVDFEVVVDFLVVDLVVVVVEFSPNSIFASNC